MGIGGRPWRRGWCKSEVTTSCKDPSESFLKSEGDAWRFCEDSKTTSTRLGVRFKFGVAGGDPAVATREGAVPGVLEIIGSGMDVWLSIAIRVC